MRRVALVVVLAGAALVGLAGPAAAHPLGNFTTNTADRIVVGADDVRVVHVVDLAEIPTLQLRASPTGPDTDRDGQASDAELATWSTGECGRIAPGLSLVLDGEPAPLAVTAASARTVPGQAGLATQRLECTFEASRTAARVEFSDPTSAGLTGWKEVSATALCGSVSGDLPQDSPSALLTTYPADLLSSPLDVTQAAFDVTAGGTCREDGSVPSPNQLLPRGVDRLTTAYSEFVGRQDLTLPVALLAVLLSVALGVGHAVAPGHGKTVIAAYLVGQRGTKRQALWLGATVTATHTAGVLLLGAVLSLTNIASPERFIPATEVASGLLLAGVGVFLLRRALRARGAGHGHSHGPGGHTHGLAGHEHGSGHEHDHGPGARDHEHGPGGHEHEHGSGEHEDAARGLAAGHAHPHEDHDHEGLHADHGQGHDGHEHGAHGDHDHGDHPHPHPHVQEPARELVGAGAGPAQSAAAQEEHAHGGAGVHSHGGHSHSHLPPEDQPLGWRTLATMGIAGGLVPSPSALVVLLGAAALGRPVFGALLVVGYGAGMAITLTLAGLLLLRAQARLSRGGWTSGRTAQLVRVLPAITAVIVLVVGAVVVLRGLLTFRGLG